MKKSKIYYQIPLWPEARIKVEYWHYPFDIEGNYIFERMDKFTEIVLENRLPDYLSMLNIIGAVGVKHKEI